MLVLVLLFFYNKLAWNTELISTGGALSVFIFKLNKLDFNLLFIVLVVISSSSWKSSKTNLPWLVFFAVFLTITSGQLSDYWSSREASTVDIQLINGVMSLHPVILLTTYALLIKTSYFIFIDLNSFYFFNKNLSRVVKQGVFKRRSLIATLLFNLFSFLIGAYWALQELNWGGYWSWDPIESYSLAVLVLLYTYSHFVNFNVKLPSTLFKVIFIIVMLVTVRLGFVESVHSFIISNSANISLLLGTGFIATSLLTAILISFLMKHPFIFKSPELMLIRTMLFIANTLASLILLYSFTVATVSVYPRILMFFNENLLMIVFSVLIICGYINTFNIPIIFLKFDRCGAVELFFSL